MTRKAILSLIIIVMLASACQAATPPVSGGKKTIVVTYSILGALVKALAGDKANIIVLIPNGQDPHEWEPSAKDIEILMKADLLVQNGLNLEGGLQKTFTQAKSAGVKTFVASDYITIRKVQKGEGIPNGSSDQQVGASDPHIWTDPLTMKQVVIALADQIKKDLSLDLSVQAQDLETQLDNLNTEITSQVASLPQSKRKLVTGHESLGYFAQRYGFKLVGAIIPSLTSQAEVSASDLATLKVLIQENQVTTIFTELGTPASVSDAIGRETGVKVVTLSTHILPSDGSYFTFMHNLAGTIVNSLQ